MSSLRGINAYRFRIPIKRKLVLSGNRVSEREGILLERDGHWAEASPLPGFSKESISDVITALNGELKDGSLPASLSFALSSLHQPMPAQLKVPLNRLLMGDEETIVAEAKQCDALGFQAVKLKVGRNDLETEISLVRKIRDLLPDRIGLRLDANQAWSFDQAARFANRLKDVDLEYIEEPLQEPNQLERLHAQTGIGYALDETLTEAHTLERWPNAAALICKPTILGGRTVIERLAATGKPIVFSAAFESGVGIARVMQLAVEFSPNTPAGLDTLAWLGNDVLVRSPDSHDGFMIVDDFQ
ncbi:MAG: o-succinylbenzoate synthase, partial [Planctomycetota bacterium]